MGVKKVPAIAALLVCAACTGGKIQQDVCRAGVHEVAVSAASGPCVPIQVTGGICNVQDSGFAVDQYVWSDDSCLQRTAEMVPNLGMDPLGEWGGYMRRYTYVVDGNIRNCEGTNRDAPGFGWLVNHFDGGFNVADSRWNQGNSAATLFQGPHHAIHQYTWSYDIGGVPTNITVQWLFATGRPHPLWAVTFDTSQSPNQVAADSRSPYGAFGWDGGTQANVDGVGWGDHSKFETLASPVTLQSGWDYTQPNTIPYDRSWSVGVDAEMGSVQTQTYMQHDAGGFGFYTSRGTQNANGPMPGPTNWPFQINQYELPYLASKKIAWGTNFGAVGLSSYPSYDGNRTLVGSPYQSYSVYIVLGTHTSSPVLTTVTQQEASQNTTFAAINASADTEGPAGVGRTDTQTFSPVGYNPVYGTWDAHVTQTGLPIILNVATNGGTLHHPMYVIHNWTRPLPIITLNGKTLTGDMDYYASIDTAHQDLWLTLGSDLTGVNVLQLN